MTVTFEALGTVHTRCCATCGHWIRPLSGFGDPAYADSIRARECRVNNKLVTLDLAVCSRWQQKPTDSITQETDLDTAMAAQEAAYNAEKASSAI